MLGIPRRPCFLRLAGGLLCLAILCVPGPDVRAARLADTIIVTTTIQAAIDAAEDGDTVSIPTEMHFAWYENLTIDKSLTLAAQPYEVGDMAIINPDGNNRIITVTPGHNLVVKDLELAGGYSGGPGTNEGGAIYIQNGTLTIDHCLINGNKGNYGGAVRQVGTGQVIVQNDSALNFNEATVDGGAIAADGNVSLTDSNLGSNVAGRHGGGASVSGALFSAARGDITDNQAVENGGGVNASNSVTVNQVDFVGNTAGTNGGAILQWNGNSTYSVLIERSTFDANSAGLTGGALSVYQGATTTINSSLFENNEVDTQSATDPKGGAVYFADTSWGHTLSISGSTFRSNSMACVLCGFPRGGGLYAQTNGPGAVVLNQDSFVDNDGWLGGGVYADRATIDRTTFQGNTGGDGAGAYLTGASQIDDSAFLQNSAVNSGGGLFVGFVASLSMEDTKFIGNTGGHDLGGAMAVHAQTITMKNVAVADTQVSSGGAVDFANPASTIDLYHMTVNDTHLAGGARTGTFGIHVKGPDIVNIWNSIITNHGTGVQVDANSACSLDHTLWYGNAQNINGAAGSYADYYPVSADPAYAVDRYHLTSASAAIDRGVDRLLYHDIDGEARDSLPDIGADEFRAHVYLPLVTR